MFKTITAAIFLTFTVTASADDACNNISLLAETIMEAHQNGVPLPDVVNVLKSNFDDEGAIQAATRMAAKIYLTPRYSTAEFQRKAVGDYRDTAFATCISMQ